jgi:hypothetical protein
VKGPAPEPYEVTASAVAVVLVIAGLWLIVWALRGWQ